MVCGIATDPQYGPMMMFGLGGVFVEVMKDVTFRIAPLTDNDAIDMIKSVKAYKLLKEQEAQLLPKLTKYKKPC